MQSDDVESANGAKDTEYLLIDGTLCIGFIVVEVHFSDKSGFGQNGIAAVDKR